MVKRFLVVTLMATSGLSILSSCGGSNDSSTEIPKGSVIFLIGDTPLCDVISFYPAVNGIQLTPENGAEDAKLLENTYIRVNFPALRDFTSMLGVATLQESAYTHVTILLSGQSIFVYDPTLDPPTKTLSASLTETKPRIALDPPLIISKDRLSVMHIDFDLKRSLEVDTNNQLTGNVRPHFRVTTSTLSEEHGYGPIDGLFGFIRSVATVSTNPEFIGSFQLQLLSGTGPAATINLTNDTEKYGFDHLNELSPGSFAELDGSIDASGNFVATLVEIQDRESLQDKKAAFLGYVVSLTKEDSNLTGFRFYVQQSEPDVSFGLGSEVYAGVVAEVTVTPETVFQFSSRPVNFASLPFDTTSLAPGQQLVVHGIYDAPEDQPVTIAAHKVYLKLQTIQGEFSSLIRVESDDRTGAFQLAPCCTLLHGTPVYVMTNSQTAFVNVSGLTGLSLAPERALLIKGLPFFQAEAGTIHGVSVPAGTLVLLAKQVHQLD